MTNTFLLGAVLPHIVERIGMAAKGLRKECSFNLRIHRSFQDEIQIEVYRINLKQSGTSRGFFFNTKMTEDEAVENIEKLHCELEEWVQ
ncbi:MAG: hypothetical protein J6T35_08810 [Bacteroidales bacterium]|nr:hypothetical protein [Bacteroidales bacterium]